MNVNTISHIRKVDLRWGGTKTPKMSLVEAFGRVMENALVGIAPDWYEDWDEDDGDDEDEDDDG